MSLTLAVSARSDAGPVREHNEDAVFVAARLVAVADGVGGAAAGEVASEAAIGALHTLEKSLLRAPLDVALAEAIVHADETIAFIASCRPATAGMATTLTVVALDDDWLVAGVGDSRAYLLRDGALHRLTRDDTLVQELVEAGVLAAADAARHPQRHVVTRVLDGALARPPRVERLFARAGDRVLLCSDGLTDVADDAAVATALGLADRDAAADALLALAQRNGARDNVSLVVADAVHAGPDAPRW